MAGVGTLASAQPCDDEELEGDPEDYTDLFAEQEAIWDLLFTGDFAWCTGSGWLMDTEITGAPIDPFEVTTYSGETLDQQPFLFDVGLFVPFTDWENVEGVTQEELEYVQDNNYTFAVVGGIVHGPSQTSVELWGIAQSIDEPGGGRVHMFIPAERADVLPEPVVIPGHIQPGTPLYNCLADAMQDYNLCMEAAEDRLGICLAGAFGGSMTYMMKCFLKNSIPPIPVKALLKCGLKTIVGFVGLVGVCMAEYAVDRNACLQQYQYDSDRCHRDHPLPSDPNDP